MDLHYQQVAALDFAVAVAAVVVVVREGWHEAFEGLPVCKLDKSVVFGTRSGGTMCGRYGCMGAFCTEDM